MLMSKKGKREGKGSHYKKLEASILICIFHRLQWTEKISRREAAGGTRGSLHASLVSPVLGTNF